MLVALAVVWIVVFLPSVTNRNQDKSEVVRERRLRREQLTVNASQAITELVRKARARKRVFVSAAALAAIGGLVAVLQGSTLWAAVATALAASFALMFRFTSSKVARAIEDGSKRRTKIGPGLDARMVDTTAEEPEVDDQSWKPTQVPEQTYQNRLGTLESPTLADVVEIESSRELARETLDEILRRRRAN